MREARCESRAAEAAGRYTIRRDAERACEEKPMTDDKVAAFAGRLAESYDRYLVPLNFAPYAEVVADRARGLRPRRVLETAAGTGVVTEALSRSLPSDVAITATDINLAMIERGRARPGMERVALAAGRCDEAAVRRRRLRPGRVPVRRHVFPRQAGFVSRVLPRPCSRRDLPVRGVGRLRHHEPLTAVDRNARGRGHAGARSADPAVPGLPRRAHHSRRPGSNRIPRGAHRSGRASRRRQRRRGRRR